jgi:Mrp family chromosome partitioning ATPase
MPNPVLLIDADARNRAVTNGFRINGSPGLREYLAGSADTASCVHRQRIDNLAVMSPGSPYCDATQPAATPPETQSNGRFDEMMSGYRVVVVDLPADSELDLQAPSADWLSETVLVVEAERTRIQAAQRAKIVLERSGVRVAGVVLAGRREHIPGWLYQRL